MILSEQIAEVLTQARTDAGISQQQLADRLGITKKTVQNYESGTICPRMDQAIEWFRALHIQPIPRFLRVLHGNVITNANTDREIEIALHEIVGELSADDRRKLVYCLTYNHGSSPSGVIDMICAHLHAPLRDRLNVATIILNNYEFARDTGTLIGEDKTQPDAEYLSSCIKNAMQAARRGEREYIGGKL